MDLSEDEISSLLAWIDDIPLSRPKRNITRDFSDGVAAAEVIHHFSPKLVDMHNYSPANAVSQKLYNWNTLNQKVFRKLGYTATPELISSIVACKPGHVEYLLYELRKKVDIHPLTSQTLTQQNQQIEQYQTGRFRYRDSNGAFIDLSRSTTAFPSPEPNHLQQQQQQSQPLAPPPSATNGLPALPNSNNPSALPPSEQGYSKKKPGAVSGGGVPGSGMTATTLGSVAGNAAGLGVSTTASGISGAGLNPGLGIPPQAGSRLSSLSAGNNGTVASGVAGLGAVGGGVGGDGKDLMIKELQETIQILQLKVVKLEQLLVLKDRRIDELLRSGVERENSSNPTPASLGSEQHTIIVHRGTRKVLRNVDSIQQTNKNILGCKMRIALNGRYNEPTIQNNRTGSLDAIYDFEDWISPKSYNSGRASNSKLASVL
ncbi:Sperm flagellar protein 1 [Phlyctochytrium planicorne]|nr:Sperm flagellar protein 1 [Phlyctochytrium planicorne]